MRLSRGVLVGLKPGLKVSSAVLNHFLQLTLSDD